MTEKQEMSEGKLLCAAFGVPAPDGERTAQTVALEIRTLQRQAQGIILSYAVEIGRRLEEAKAMVPHGSWGVWLKEELGFSASTAQNFMRVFREYGDEQQSMFGAPKSQTFGHLTYTKALRLLAIEDEEERAQFVAENDVEHMSTRELDEAIKARDAAEEDAAAAKEAADKAQKEAELLREKLAQQAQQYEARLTARGVDTETAKKERDALQKKLDALREKAPADSREAVEKARREAMAEMSGKVEKAAAARKKAEDERKAAEEALAGIRKELDELRARAEEKKETVPPQTAERLRELEKRLAAADPDVAEFRVRYAAWQEEYQRMMAVLGRLADGAQAEKLRAAVAAALAQMGGAQNGRQHGSENV